MAGFALNPLVPLPVPQYIGLVYFRTPKSVRRFLCFPFTNPIRLLVTPCMEWIRGRGYVIGR